ncbi:MAG: adenylyltransferase/cytidyltransferase family protein [Promethearchaeota archaeon]
MGKNKIITRNRLIQLREDWERKKFNVVTTNGCFDIIHKGHIYLFDCAKEYGHIVVVGMNSDESVKRLKGNKRPINSQEDRAYVLSGLENVSYVYIFDEDNPLEFLKTAKPHYHIKSKEGYKGLEESVMDKKRIILIEDIPSYSTSEIIRRINES